MTETRVEKVLIVDNDIDVANILSTILQAHRYDVRVAFDSTTALQLAQSFLPHAAVIDLGSSTMDTYEVAARLRHIPKLSDIYLICLFDSVCKPSPVIDGTHINVRLLKPTAHRKIVDALTRYFTMRL